MRVTFLIGNGFDINLGLKTRYSDFLDWYIKQPSVDGISFDDDLKVMEFKDDLANKRWDKWWSDVECAMGQFLGRYDNSNIRDYYIIIRDLKIRLAEYLRSEQSKCSFSNSDEIAITFRRFLLSFEDEIMLNRGLQCLPRKSSIDYYFINFNYTNTLQKTVQCTKKLYDPLYNNGARYDYVRRVIPVHGTLDSSIIMGVNDSSQLSLDNVRVTDKLNRTMVKVATNTGLGRRENSDAEEIVSQSDVIAISGCPLALLTKSGGIRYSHGCVTPKATSSFGLRFLPQMK